MCFRCANEGGGNDRDTGDATLFELCAVVETPRRARPSIADTIDDSSTVRRKAFDHALRRAFPCFRLLDADEAHILVMRAQALLQIVENLIGVVFVVIEKADGDPGVKRLGGLAFFGTAVSRIFASRD